MLLLALFSSNGTGGKPGKEGSACSAKEGDTLIIRRAIVKSLKNQVGIEGRLATLAVGECDISVSGAPWQLAMFKPGNVLTFTSTMSGGFWANPSQVKSDHLISETSTGTTNVSRQLTMVVNHPPEFAGDSKQGYLTYWNQGEINWLPYGQSIFSISRGDADRIKQGQLNKFSIDDQQNIVGVE